MNVAIIRSVKVCDPAPYFLGLSFGSNQVRIGLVLWHVVILV